MHFSPPLTSVLLLSLCVASLDATGGPALAVGPPTPGHPVTYKGVTLQTWVQRALGDDRALRKAAALALLEVRDWELADQAVPLFQPALKSKDAEVAARARRALDLLELGWLSRTKRDRLVRQLSDRDALVRRRAASDLLLLGRGAASIAPTLTKLLDDPDLDVRRQVATTLAVAGPSGKAAVPVLIDMVKNGDAIDQCIAATSLGRIGPGAAAAVPTLATLLTSGSELRREEAARALGRIGAKAKPALPQLRKALEDRRQHVRTGAAVAVWRVTKKPTESLKYLIDAVHPRNLKDPTRIHGELIRLSLQAIREMGPQAKDAAPTLLKLLKHEEDGIAWWAGQALKAVDPKAAWKAGLR
jgi:HEAT repeat protein